MPENKGLEAGNSEPEFVSNLPAVPETAGYSASSTADDQQSGASLIAMERLRQISQEGWTSEHDDAHAFGELAEAATCYASAALYCVQGWDPQKVTNHLSFPWPGWWKPSPDPIRNLVKAGALIAAEIDRLQRRKP